MSLAPSFTDIGHSPNHVAIIMDGNGRWRRPAACRVLPATGAAPNRSAPPSNVR